MKKAIVILLTLVASNAVAGQKQLFSNHSSHTTAVFSSVQDVRGIKTKTLHVTGVTTLGNYSSGSGVVTPMCAPEATGPWNECKTGATVVSLGDRGVYTWDDTTNYIKLRLVRLAGKLKTSAWLSW